MKILYLAGYGRSGSTVFERILGQHPSIVATGEISNFDEAVEEECSCGDWVKSCELWQPILEEYLESKDTTNSRWTRTVKSLVGNVHAAGVKNMHLLLDLLAKAQPQKHYAIDSSKTTRVSFLRPFFLRKKYEVKIIHLVRDGRSCLSSNMKMSNLKFLQEQKEVKVPYAFIRTLLSWNFANVIALSYRLLLGKSNYLLIRYEDFIENYAVELERIGVFLGEDMTKVIQQIEEGKVIKNCHQIRGNRVSRIKEFYLKTNLSDVWRTELKKYQSFSFTVFSLPLMLLFKYLK